MNRAAAWAAVILAACEPAPTYLRPAGYIGDRLSRLGWLLLVIACAVVVVVGVLVLAASLRRRPDVGTGLVRSGGGLRWIVVGGIVIPAVILLGTMIYSVAVLAETARPPANADLTVEVVGHRWWWEVRYPGHTPQDVFTTANEIHIPARTPVRLELSTADVIHSFWIPQLAGKTDLIPGQRNQAWIEADTPGRYWGHCGEYCGLQHANMMLSVVVDEPAAFRRWLDTERRTAARPASGLASSGREVFERSACALCHTIRGTPAGGALGPDLTHVAARGTIAAGTLTNTAGHLTGWIANPQALKPGVLMPAVPLKPDELHALVEYLGSLH